MDQPKLERLLRLMKMLTANNSLTIKEIADRLGITARSVYRYVDTFRDAGFVVKKNGNYIKLDKSSPYFRDISELIHFTEEEAFILKSAIESIDENNLLKQNLKKKLYTVYDYNILSDTIVNGKHGQNVKRLVEAIENKKQVILKEYSSAHGNTVRDRVVEPYSLTTNYVQVWCYCPDEKTNKLFKVTRIGSVEILDRHWINEEDHKAGREDVFRMNSDTTTPIKLKLAIRPAQLLMEEYPLSAKYMTKLNKTEWLFEAEVCSFEGVGRFVMGLLDEIEIVDSPQLQKYIEERIKKVQNKFAVT
jgi:predicted DNA-binding transcriptional regulator YafY